MRKSKRRLLLLIPVSLACVAASAGIADRLASDATATPKNYLADDFCIKCHPNDHALKAIRDKSGRANMCEGAVARYKASGEWKLPHGHTGAY